jgi:oligopeptide/dipeptide ABC transporter ATP-binding protein
MTAILEIQHLHVGRENGGQFQAILDDVHFSVHQGETLAVVGESGCGKSMTALSIMGLLPRSVQIASGNVRLSGKSLIGLSRKEIDQVRGKEIAMIFQEPMTSLNPSFTIGAQLAEVLKLHTPYQPKERKERVLELLDQVGIPDPQGKFNAYPHELSGGMRQRVMIAMALACNPKVLIADEPTTALDVTIQAQVLDLLSKLQGQYQMAVMLITHDLGVVAETSKRVVVMYAGQVIEEADVEDLFEAPLHPYTRGLMQSAPRLGRPKEKLHVIEGTVPDIREMPKGCRFHPRCQFATSQCRNEQPRLEEAGNGRRVRCWLAMAK